MMKPTTNFKRLRMLLALLLLALVVMAAYSVMQRALQSGPVLQGRSRLPAWQAWLGKTPLKVSAQPGIHVFSTTHGDILTLNARQQGRTEIINLCHQRTGNPSAPESIYPLHIGGDFSNLRSSGRAGAAHHALVLEPALAPRMPQLVIAGDAGRADQSGLRLRVQTPADGMLLPGKRLLADNPAELVLDVPVWILGDRQAPDRYAHAINIARRAALTGETTSSADRRPCAAGVLEVRLYAALVARSSLSHLILLAGRQPARHAYLPEGEYVLPDTSASRIEDGQLFDAAVAAGLIRLENDGRIAVIPAEWRYRAVTRSDGTATWPDVRADVKHQALFERLYDKADGAWVRKQINEFNQELWWSAVRWQAGDAALQDQLANPAHYRVTLDGVALGLTSQMPDESMRLQESVPTGWSPWLRFSRWPALTRAEHRVQVELTVSMDKAQQVSLMTLGRLLEVQGGKRLASRNVCLRARCPEEAALQLHTLALAAGQSTLHLTLGLDPRLAGVLRQSGTGNPIQLAAGRLSWRDATVQAAQARTERATIVIRDRANQTLYADNQPTAMAATLGLETLVGLGAGHTTALSGILGRAGALGATQLEAQLTLEPKYQQLAQSVLECVGHAARQWDVATHRCSDFPLHASKSISAPPDRRTAMVVLDADSGAILAMSNTPRLPTHASPAELLAFDRYNPQSSALQIQATQHNGNSQQMPGSTFKLVSALALEQTAKHNPSLEHWLAGQTPDAVVRDSIANQLGFTLGSGCYPHDCPVGDAGRRSVQLSNFREHRPIDYLQDGRFGLRQALAYSLNSWFAFLAEQTDQTLAGPAQGNAFVLTRALGGQALDPQRPLMAMAHRLGFEQAQRLDGGLLPAGFDWNPRDVLQTTPSTFDEFESRHSVRQFAVGFRMQVTPLQMAQVAAAIATGKPVQPYLLAQLNGVAARPVATSGFDFSLERIRAGMHDVVTAGTARATFAVPQRQGYAAGVFAKTGTADMRNTGQNALNISWFTGYLAPNTLPHESRRLAFAVMVTHTEGTGGEHAAEVLASWLDALSSASARN